MNTVNVISKKLQKLGLWNQVLKSNTVFVLVLILSDIVYAYKPINFGSFGKIQVKKNKSIIYTTKNGKVNSILYQDENKTLIENFKPDFYEFKMEIQYATAKSVAIIKQQRSKIKSVGLFLTNYRLSFLKFLERDCNMPRLTESISKLKVFNRELISRSIHSSCNSVDEDKISYLNQKLIEEYDPLKSIFLRCLTNEKAIFDMQNSSASNVKGINSEYLENFLLHVLSNYQKAFEDGQNKIRIACEVEDKNGGILASAKLDKSGNDDNGTLISFKIKNDKILFRDENKKIENVNSCDENGQIIFHELLHTKEINHDNPIFKIVEDACVRNILGEKCRKNFDLTKKGFTSTHSVLDDVNKTQQQHDIRADQQATSRLVNQVQPIVDTISPDDLSGLESPTDSKSYNTAVDNITNKMEKHANYLFGMMNKAIADTPVSDYSNDNYKRPTPSSKVEEITTEEYLANESGLSLPQFRNLAASLPPPSSNANAPVEIRDVVNTKLLASTIPTADGKPAKMNFMKARNIMGLPTNQFSKDSRLPVSSEETNSNDSTANSNNTRPAQITAAEKSIATQLVTESKVQELIAYTAFKGSNREELIYMLKQPEFIAALKARKIQIMDKDNKIYGYSDLKPVKRFVDNGSFLIAQGAR